jgi:DNA polymerase-3 subunit epsilon
MLKAKPLFNEVAPKILSLMENSIVVCHNAPFDIGFLHAECRREGIEVPACSIIDTLALARHCFRFYRNSLGDITLDLGIEAPNAHHAMADVETALAIFVRFMLDFKVRGITTLEEIFSLQASSRYQKPKGFPAIPPHLEEAVEHKKPVKIKYVSAIGKHTIRIVEPIEIVSERDSLYLIAYCRLRNAERNFRLDRIIEISPSEGTGDQSDLNISRGYEDVFGEIFKGEPYLIADMQLIKPTLDGLIAGLAERERMILQMRFGLSDGQRKTLQQIGNVLGITRERVRQLEKGVMRKLKHPSRRKQLLQKSGSA